MDKLNKIEELKKFEETLKGKSLKELHKIEEDIVKEADKIDNEISNKKFKLPDENYEIVATAIRTLLSKKTVQWQFALGLVTMYEFWDPEKMPDDVVYPMLDGTLRTLGEQSFTGYEEWAMVVAINKYFEPIRDEYINATEKIYDIASKHNAVIDAINKNTPINVKNNE